MLEEAKFFGISKAIEPLEALVQTEELSVSGHFSRKEFLRMLSITSSSAVLRCQVSCGHGNPVARVSTLTCTNDTSIRSKLIVCVANGLSIIIMLSTTVVNSDE